MNKETVQKIKENPDYKKLVSTRNSFAVKLSILMLVVYFVFILTIAFNPVFLGSPLSSGSVTTVGIPVGMGIIVFAIVLTGIYTQRANGEFDELSNRVKESIREI
ncbi:MAG: hypothetical protein QG559_987 [Campylobacterota bacterium]|nr:hypothetical protein [Campylobacterota bacterium]